MVHILCSRLCQHKTDLRFCLLRFADQKCRKLFLRLKGVADHEEKISDKISLFLQSTDKHPAEPVDFQLWLADHADVCTTISRGKLPCSRAVLFQILTVLITCRLLHNLQLIRLRIWSVSIPSQKHSPKGLYQRPLHDSRRAHECKRGTRCA